MSRFYLSAPVDEVQLAAEVAPAVASLGRRLPSSEELRACARDKGMDFATMLLYRALLAVPQHREFIDRLEAQPIAADRAPADAKVLVVPALFHGHYPEAGAD